MRPKKTAKTGTTTGKCAGSTTKAPGKREKEGLDDLNRIRATLEAALALARSLDVPRLDEVHPASDFPFRVDVMGFAIAVDAELLFATLGGGRPVPMRTKARARSVLEIAYSLSEALEVVTKRLGKGAHANPLLADSLRNMARVVGKFRKDLDVLHRSWIVADLCLLALIGRARTLDVCAPARSLPALAGPFG